jgi:hypothetical protein
MRLSLGLAGFLLFHALFVPSARASMASFDLVEADWKFAISTFIPRDGAELTKLRSASALASAMARQLPSPALDAAVALDLSTINAVTSLIRPNIAAAGSPVLLPFDVARFSADLMSPSGAQKTKSYMGRAESLAFYPGPYGYRAYMGLRKTSTVMISGSTILYRIAGGTKLPETRNCISLIEEARRPDGEADAFFKYLKAYEESIGKKADYFNEVEATVPCLFSGALVEINILCDANGDKDCRVRDLAREIFASLNFVGGTPRSKERPNLNDPIKRLSEEVENIDKAAKASGRDVQKYAEPGVLAPNSGVKSGSSGSRDPSVYGPILYPTDFSAVAQTVVFREDERCLQGTIDRGETCETKQGALVEKVKFDEWRDNFCENRSANSLPACPEGAGHAGQDMWGKKWPKEPNVHPLRAVVDGVAFRRFPAQPAVTVSDVAGTNIDYIYRHMRPSMLDAQGIQKWVPQQVRRGCTLAYADRLQGIADDQKNDAGKFVDGGVIYDPTSRHLHFEIRVPTKAGYQNVAPYQTVVQAHRAGVTKVDTSPASTTSCANVPLARRSASQRRGG